MAFIEINGVWKAFASRGSARPVLRDLTLSVEQGEFVSIVGTMGCGKSTLRHIVAGLLPPDAGRVTVDGEVLHGIRHGVSRRRSGRPWSSTFRGRARWRSCFTTGRPTARGPASSPG